VHAAVLFVAQSICRHYGLSCISANAILAATGASRTRTYQLAASLRDLLPAMIKPNGRPPRCESAKAIDSPVSQLSCDMLQYVVQHPGCVNIRKKRHWYSDGLRYHVLILRKQYSTLAFDVFAQCVCVPEGTLKNWLAPTNIDLTTSQAKLDEEPTPSTPNTTTTQDAMSAQIETVLAEWSNWHGTFTEFVNHIRHEVRIPIGRQLIANILEACNVRSRKKRSGRSPDELALRGAFATFFSGAQWVGDGKLVRVSIGKETFEFNLELQVDPHSGACVGLSTRDTEDSTAVIDSFKDGVATTGKAPIAELLDNKPCNDSPEVDATLADHNTIHIRATKGRPENKGHVEGAFGLFSQSVPPIELDSNQDKHSLARALLFLVATTWFRAINHRPRADRGGLSRKELYQQKPTDEQIAEARRSLEERCRKQNQARLTLAARERPEVRTLLDSHFERLGFIDPKRNIRLAIGRYPLDAIIDGIAIFDAKLQTDTLPESADARYLLGIVRNLVAKNEGTALARRLLALRIEARDQALLGLVVAREQIRKENLTDTEMINICVERAFDNQRSIDQLFWIDVLADEVAQRSINNNEQRDQLFFAATNRINTTFRVPPQKRQEASRQFANQVLPLS
jgi:hypothetical protein